MTKQSYDERKYLSSHDLGQLQNRPFQIVCLGLQIVRKTINTGLKKHLGGSQTLRIPDRLHAKESTSKISKESYAYKQKAYATAARHRCIIPFSSLWEPRKRGIFSEALVAPTAYGWGGKSVV